MQISTSKIEHLNGALRAIRNVNRLLVNENDRDRLLDTICQVLIESRSYDKVWIAVLDGQGELEAYAESGVGNDFGDIVSSGQLHKRITCAQKALSQEGTYFIKNPATAIECKECPLVARHAGWGALTVRLTHGGEVYGLLSVSIPNELVSDDVEQALIAEIAGDIAFGLHRLRREEVHRKTDAALEKRVNELNYFFSFSNLVEKPGIALDDILQGGVNLLPAAMQYPEIAFARIKLEDRVYATENYSKTKWYLSNAIRVNGAKSGSLEVGYLEEREPEFTGPFLWEEQQLVNAAALRIGKIIERKHGRKALEDSERRFRDLVENSMTCIFIIQDSQVVYFNPEYKRLFGSVRNILIPPTPEFIHPDELAEVDTAITSLLKGHASSADLEFRLYASPKIEENREAKWVHCRVCKIEHLGKDAILFNLMDISRAKELEHMLRMKDKMASLGRVAAGIAHEIRNPLSGINIYLKALEKSCENAGQLEGVADIIYQLQSASNKVESVIKRVMDFSRPTEPRFVLTEINLPVEEAVNLLSPTLEKQEIQIYTDLNPDLPPCYSDPHMIEQVILNLITNASEAMQQMETGKKISIVTNCDRETVYISVSDAGPGVPLNIRDKIFDPFYTTKHNSSGIGLSICQRIMTDHKAKLEVYSSDFGGARFIVRFPLKTGLYKRL